MSNNFSKMAVLSLSVTSMQLAPTMTDPISALARMDFLVTEKPAKVGKTVNFPDNFKRPCLHLKNGGFLSVSAFRLHINDVSGHRFASCLTVGGKKGGFQTRR